MKTHRMVSRTGRNWFAYFVLASASVAVSAATANAQTADKPNGSATQPQHGAPAAAPKDGAAAAAKEAPRDSGPIAATAPTTSGPKDAAKDVAPGAPKDLPRDATEVPTKNGDAAKDPAGSTPKSAAAEPLPTASAAPAQAGSNKSEADAAADEAAAAAAATIASSSSGGGEEPKLNLYGFTDFTYVNYTKPPTTGSPNSKFFIGNLNVYIGTDWGDNWRALTEIRFMYLPDGTTQPGTTSSRWDTSVPDYTSNAVPIAWGGIHIERVWLERTLHQLLTIRAGHFLTPYGIWNVDHGSPTIIGINKPLVVSNGLFPTAQTGLEIYGAWTSGATQLGYHLTLSNGRGPYDTYLDLDSNKGLGGRLFLRTDAIAGTITAGISGYAGTYTNGHDQNAVIGGVTKSQQIIDAQYDEQSLAGDVKWQLGGLHWQNEIVMNQISYTNGGRPTSGKGLAADRRNWGFYSLAGYRLPFFGIMPYGCVQYYQVSATGAETASVNGGLNIRATPRVVLKGQLIHIWGLTGTAFNQDKIELQASWSF